MSGDAWYGRGRYFAALGRLDRVTAGHGRRLNAAQNRRALKHSREAHRILLRHYVRRERAGV
ncbi:MAG: hypothetical protein RL077_338 [Verrucomicrobiota bacterium]|jgi:hypothetical protein